MTKQIDFPRQIALQILYQIETEGTYSNIALDKAINKNRKQLSSQDIGFISEIVYGTITWKYTLDVIIRKYSNIRLKKISIWILNILRMAIYQIIFLERVPKSAATNEAVKLANRYGHKASSNFVNAILRKIDPKDLEEIQKIKEPVERISKSFSLPEWLTQLLLKEYPQKVVEEIAKNSVLEPKLAVRINPLKITKEQLKQQLQDQQIEVQDGLFPNTLHISHLKNIAQLENFQKGEFIVQDEGATMIGELLSPMPGERVLDCCSAPGGKTTHLAEKMKNQGEIIAWDLHEHRLKLVEENAKRMGISIIKTEKKDATILEKQYVNQFDKVLLDVPCLGFGVLKRKPDIKWQRKQEDIAIIKEIQKQILTIGAKYLKKEGTLLYATCSLLLEENETIILEFLKENDFEIVEIDKNRVPEKFQKYTENKQWIKILPNTDTDGFFMCLLRKK